MLIRVVLFCIAASTLLADEEKKPGTGNEVPVLSSIQPIAVTLNVTNKVVLRGKNLADVTKLRFSGSTAAIQWKPSAKPEKPEDKKKTEGDPTLEAEFILPVDAIQGTNIAFIATNSKGDSKPQYFYVAAPGKLLEEKEPNDGFKGAQSLEPGISVNGSISSVTDVDVFKISAKAGQKLRFEILAARLGSALDSSLTLYNSKGTILTTNDDAMGKDPVITQTIANDGDYFIALTCVNELPAKTAAPYVLKAGIEP